MAGFTLAEVVLATGGTLRAGQQSAMFAGVSTDSRKIQAADLYVPLVGERFDGHDFIGHSLQAGAAGTLFSRPGLEPLGTGAWVQVQDTTQAYQALAQFHRRRFTIPVVAVTGSNGKTTTKNMVAAVLSSRLQVHKTPANFNNEIGLPLTLLGMSATDQAAVVEMGMRAKGEIAVLAAIAEPTGGVVTNVGDSHKEILGSRQEIAAAKSELVQAVTANGFVILNGDDSLVRPMAAQTQARVIFYGTQSDCGVWAEEIVFSPQGTRLLCHCHGEQFILRLPVVGHHNVYNALATVAVAWELGLGASDIQAGFDSYRPEAMREELLERGGVHIINDAYNASPASMAGALETLAQIAPGRRIAVLGDMLELGEDAGKAHWQVGHLAAAARVDILITVGELGREIARGGRQAGIVCVENFADRQKAGEYLRSCIKQGDTVLLKASRALALENLLSIFIEEEGCKC